MKNWLSESRMFGKTGIRMRTIHVFVILLSVVFFFMFVRTIRAEYAVVTDMQQETDRYIAGELAAADMRKGIHYLTTQARLFVTRPLR